MDKTLLHLLIVGELAEDGEMLTHIFRESRYLLKTQRIADRASLAGALNKGGWDALVSRNNVAHLRPETLADVLAKAGQDLPCIVFADRVESADVVRLLERGIHDVVPASQPERLPAVIGRELAAAQTRALCRASERACQEMESKLGALSATVRDAFCYSQDGMHIETNRAYRDLFGYESPDALEGVPVLNLVKPSDQNSVKDYFRRAAKGESRTQEFTAMRHDGSTFAAEMQIHNLQLHGETCQQIVVHERAATDAAQPPVALGGRIMLLSAMANAGTDTALLYFDLDRLGALNVARGNAAGDQVLASIERVLSSIKDGICGRVSGDEFGVLIAVPVTQANTLIKAVGTRATAEHGISLSASVSYRGPEESDVAWLERARHLLSAQKPSTAAPAPSATPIAVTATVDIDPAQLVVLYQPIVPLHGDALEQYEVLVQHRGQILTDTTRLPLEIDLLVLEQALNTARTLHKTRHAVRILLRPGLAFMTRRDTRFAQDLGTLPPEILGFSLAERLFEEHGEALLAFVRSAKRQDLTIALDASGTGASSAQLLSQHLFEFVQIDSGLARNLTPDSLNYLLVTQAVALARKCGYKTILRSVDTADAVSTLWQCEVDYVEGAYFQEPRPEPHYDFGGEVVSTDVGANWRSTN